MLKLKYTQMIDEPLFLGFVHMLRATWLPRKAKNKMRWQDKVEIKCVIANFTNHLKSITTSFIQINYC